MNLLDSYKYKYLNHISSPLHQPINHILLLPDVDVLIIMVANEVQAENALYGENGAVSGTHMHLNCRYYYISF